jgi:hypothetical protein
MAYGRSNAQPQRSNPNHPRRERRRTGISARQQRKRIRAARRK